MLTERRYIKCENCTFEIQGEVGSVKKYSDRDSHKVYSAKAIVKSNDSSKEERFIKFILDDGSDEATYLLELMETENKFRMWYPHIATVYGMERGETEKGEKVHVLEIEYLGETNLYKEMVENKPSEEQRLAYMQQLLYAAQYYSKGVAGGKFVHKDIKPENIMIRNKNERKDAVLIDFDLAHVPGSKKTAMGKLLYQEAGEVYSVGGTEGYIDPRAYGACNVDIGLDIYSMGRVFCFCLLDQEWCGYFTNEENVRIERIAKAYFTKHPMAYEEAVEEPGWKDLVYGLDEKRLDERYRDPKYSGLRKIIRNMVAPLNERYKDFGTIIKDFEVFLKKLYPDKYDEIFMVPCVLKEVPDTDNKTRYLRCVFPKGDGEYSKTKETVPMALDNFEMADIRLAKTHVATIYNEDGNLYCMMYMGSGEKKTIQSGDEIRFEGYTVQFEIKK